MLILEKWEYNSQKINADLQMKTILDEATNVKVTEEINREYYLDFDFPVDSDKTERISEDCTVVCEGQRYRIIKTSREESGGTMHVQAMHIFHYEAKSRHIATFGGDSNTIGNTPPVIIEKAVTTRYTNMGLSSDPKLTQLTQAETEALGMARVGDDGFRIDIIDPIDKTNAWDALQQIITNSGKGEMYIDNNKFAIVERIGTDNGVRLDITRNMQNVTIERDITNMITRLYPYGPDDLNIVSYANRDYIQSDNAELYGIKEGYKDYSDYTTPEKLYTRAMWEFDAANPERIDVPDINITGEIIDLSKLSDSGMKPLHLGDTVHVIDNGTKITERVIKIERYPYEPLQTTVSIGRVKKDLFFYMNQMGKIAKISERNSTSNGKITSGAISGTITAQSSGTSEKVINRMNNFACEIADAGLTVYDETKGKFYSKKFEVGQYAGALIFNLYGRGSEGKLLCLDSAGLSVKAVSVKIGDNELKNDSDGNLCVNGKKIVLEG